VNTSDVITFEIFSPFRLAMIGL